MRFSYAQAIVELEDCAQRRAREPIYCTYKGLIDRIFSSLQEEFAAIRYSDTCPLDPGQPLEKLERLRVKCAEQMGITPDYWGHYVDFSTDDPVYDLELINIALEQMSRAQVCIDYKNAKMRFYAICDQAQNLAFLPVPGSSYPYALSKFKKWSHRSIPMDWSNSET